MKRNRKTKHKLSELRTCFRLERKGCKGIQKRLSNRVA